jgi:5-methylcytosine-specific restriction endonuclease McrA
MSLYLRKVELVQAGACCAYCGGTLEQYTHGKKRGVCATWDHIIPRSHGGSNARSNLRLSCLSCNSTRGTAGDEALRARLAKKAEGIPDFTPAQRDYLAKRGIDLKILQPTGHYYFYFELVERRSA